MKICAQISYQIFHDFFVFCITMKWCLQHIYFLIIFLRRMRFFVINICGNKLRHFLPTSFKMKILTFLLLFLLAPKACMPRSGFSLGSCICKQNTTLVIFLKLSDNMYMCTYVVCSHLCVRNTLVCVCAPAMSHMVWLPLCLCK